MSKINELYKAMVENLARIQKEYEKNLHFTKRDRELKFHEGQIKKYLELVGEEN